MSGTIIASDGEELTFDLILREPGWSLPNSVTKFPIEDGSPTNDHIQAQPEVFSIVAIMTETPFSTVLTEPFSPTRLEDTIAFLKRAKTDMVAYESVRRGLIENLAIDAIDFDVDDRNRYEFKIGFTEFRIARAQIVSIPPERLPAAKEDDMPEEVDVGDQSTDDDTDDGDGGDGEVKSLAAKLYDWGSSKTGATISIFEPSE